MHFFEYKMLLGVYRFCVPDDDHSLHTIEFFFKDHRSADDQQVRPCELTQAHLTPRYVGTIDCRRSLTDNVQGS